MDENTWRLAQVIMWGIGIQVTLILATFSGMWFILNRKFDDVGKRFDLIDKRFDQVDKRIDRLDEKTMDIDRRLCRIEGSLASKDCCMLKEDRHRKAE